jgi:hypothetical protein
MCNPGQEEQHAAAAGDDAPTVAAALTRRLRAEGVAAGVADDLVARFPAQQVAGALDVLPARNCSNAAGWLVAAISDGWRLHDEGQTAPRHPHPRPAARCRCPSPAGVPAAA